MLLNCRKKVLQVMLCICTLLILLPALSNAQQQQLPYVELITRNDVDKTPRSIKFTPDGAYKRSATQEVFKQYLGMNGGTNTMVKVKTTETKQGITIDRYQQYIKGIPAEHGNYIATIKNDIIQYINGNCFVLDATLNPTPGLTESAALAKALAAVGATKYMWESPAAEARIKAIYRKPDTTWYPKGRLVWVEDRKAHLNDRKLHLAYAFNIYATQPLSRQEVYIDATTGKILFVNNLINHTAASNRSLYSGVVPFVTANISSIYYLYDSTRGGGVYTMSSDYNTSIAAAIDITSTTNVWPSISLDTAALDVHWGAEKVYDYWLSQHGRHSWDDADGILASYVHTFDASSGGPMDNAYWDGAEMVYGDGTGASSGGLDPVVSLDVTAHEMGHGICQATANLVYEYESGAMNEGFSDCWAATIESYANPFESDAVAKSTWLIGEEVRPGSPLRNMANPIPLGDPATYNGTNWYNCTIAACPTPTSANDQCGVHTNSGVLNHWYYLVVTGGTGTNDLGTAYSVTGIGFTDAAKILYLTENTLASTDDYAACRIASINAAVTLFGACSPQEQAVTNAWYAVGVGSSFVPCIPQIGFNQVITNVTEDAGVTSCPASRTINIPLKAFGTPISGGTPTINVVAAGGTAVAGVDYNLGTTSLSFTPGDTTTHYATLTLFDNGNVNDDKTLYLAFTLSAMGSTATISPTNDTLLINIFNNDSIPTVGGSEYHILNAGSLVTSNLTSGFTGATKRGHSQFLLDASEMTAAGVRAGVPITQLAFNITTRYSSTAFVNYTVSMGNTSASDLSSGYATAGTTVFSANHTTNTGWDSLVFSTPFTWDGTSNVVVDVCYGANSSSATNNDQMQGISHSSFICTNYNGTNGGSGTGCSLSFSSANTSATRPVMRFKQNIPPTAIETAAGSTRIWDVRTGQQVYYYTPTADTNLIAATLNPTADLGCVTTAVTQAGVGFSAASFISGNRSLKEIAITPTTGSASSCDVIFYMTTTELNSVAPSTLYLLHTTAATDAGITTSNTTINTPTLITGTTYVGFKSNFTGYGRYFLTNNVFCTPPTATITPAGPTSFCSGGSVVLSAPTGTGYTYQWQLAGTDISGATNRTYTASAGGAYTVVVRSASCSATSAATTITILTTYAAMITGATGVCTGSTAIVTDSTVGGSWTTSNAAIASVNSTGTLYGVSAGTVVITYTYTNACGTTYRTASITVSAPATVAAIAGTTSACPGSTATLTDATTGGNWTTGSPLVASVNATGVVTAVSSGTATISYGVANAFGCISYATTTFTSLATPTAVITPSGSTSLCLGATVTLNATTGTGYTYQWQVGGSNIAGATTTAYTASTTGTYGLVVTNSTGCTASATTVPVTVSGTLTVVPAVSVAASPGTSVCTGTGAVTFTPTPVNGGSAPAYQWYVNGSPVSASTTYSYSPANGDVVTCKLTSNAACAFPDSAISRTTMTVSPYDTPSVSITAVPNDTVCEGNTGAFTAIPVHGGTSPSYIWNLNGTDVYSGPTYYYVPTNGDMLFVKMSSNYLCRLVTNVQSAPHMVTVVPVVTNFINITASSTSIVTGTAVTFTANTPAGVAVTYQWLINGIAIPGATSSTFTTTTLSNGQQVKCRIAATDRCVTPTSITSSSITMAVTTGVQQIGRGADRVTIEPNPNTGNFFVKGNFAVLEQGNVTIKVTNMLGQVVYTTTGEINNGSLLANVTLGNNTANGLYITTVTLNETGMNYVFQVVVGK